MQKIIPIKDLKKTGEMSNLCRTSMAPGIVTKNGYGDMVFMSMETHEKAMFLQDAYRKILAGESALRMGNHAEGFAAVKTVREKYGL
ncbi:MAG: type II toxin-antitoxin system Phd/YefM family antitoxin [Firmicutes bacterium]|nr:type II toxin-antitoxin system Phd/YefM family antitoxin [Bacillota bacterium]